MDPSSALPPTDADRLIEYVREREERRRRNVAFTVGAALVAVIVGFGAWTIHDGNRTEDEHQQRRVDAMYDVLSGD